MISDTYQPTMVQLSFGTVEKVVNLLQEFSADLPLTPGRQQELDGLVAGLRGAVKAELARYHLSFADALLNPSTFDSANL